MPRTFRGMLATPSIPTASAPAPIAALAEQVRAAHAKVPAAREAVKHTERAHAEALAGRGDVLPSKAADAMAKARRNYNDIEQEALQAEQDLTAATYDYADQWAAAARSDAEAAWEELTLLAGKVDELAARCSNASAVYAWCLNPDRPWTSRPTPTVIDLTDLADRLPTATDQRVAAHRTRQQQLAQELQAENRRIMASERTAW